VIGPDAQESGVSVPQILPGQFALAATRERTQSGAEANQPDQHVNSSEHNGLMSRSMPPGLPSYECEQDGHRVISTKPKWAVQALLGLIPSYYLPCGYSSQFKLLGRWRLGSSSARTVM